LDKTSMSEVEKEYIRKRIEQGKALDKLKSLFDMQEELDSFIFKQHADKLPEDLHDWVLKYTVAIESEIDEIRRLIGWKWWKPKGEIPMEELHEEISDLWFFLIALTQRAGMSSDDIYKVYEKKLEENYARQHGQSRDGATYDYRDEVDANENK
jgi:dimeric dUTPase (all-alpha-NTP-PPase superfamily)